ncbi:Lachesin [Nymphon striatum]|nr:Lachesin [Nymphon striatum]
MLEQNPADSCSGHPILPESTMKHHPYREIRLSSKTPFVNWTTMFVPPDIIDSQTSSDVEAVEGTNVTLFCKAFGIPVPKILWKREDSTNIILYDRNGKRHAVKEYPEEKLHFYGVSREHMGAYLCIASNGVPPPISRRISLSINFPPVLQIENQLIGTPINSQVSLTCIVQAHPKSIIYWTNSSSIIGNTAVFTSKVTRNSYKSKAELIINNVQHEHFGAYRCNAENPYGKADGIVRLYELQQGSDSRSRLRSNGNHNSDNHNLAERTEQAMSVREDLRKSGDF